MKRIFYIFAGLLLWLLEVQPQNVEMPNVVNHYLRVKSMLTDRVQVTSSSELAYFHPGDKVLLIQMTGSTMSTLPGFLTNPNKYKDEWRNAGSYEILQVDEVITGANNYVVFTDNYVNDYDDGEKIQLVRLVEGDNVTVTANVSAKPWDGYTGGIIAIIGMDSVKLNADLDASGFGFRGAVVPSWDYTGGCRKNVRNALSEEDLLVDTLHFDKYHINRAGNKGEGIVTADTNLWPYTMGAGCAVNGGGGGNGLFSGGGGGGNYFPGGDGGSQSSLCETDSLVMAWGGLKCETLYLNLHGIIMGGGGGSGVQNLQTSNAATNGGNGGGIIFIITGTLAGNGKAISANGQSVTVPATGSAGGGGAAGSVILDATNYTGSFRVNIAGGDGGEGNLTVCTGKGGGGSGGVLWHSGDDISGVTINLKGGITPTTSDDCLLHIGAYGSDGIRLKNLLVNLTGFLFNSIRGVDTICAGQVPNKITGSHPKGGTGTYTWFWQQTTDNVSWIPAIGTAFRDSIRPPALSHTTWYRRIVRSLDKNSNTISDTSRVLEIYVYPAITNNIISGTDTICYSSPAQTLTGTAPAGGNSIYQYLWQSSTDQAAWVNRGILDSYDPNPLTGSLYFRRRVTSTAYCSGTSNTVKITVLQKITHNIFASADTVICTGQGPGQLNALTPANGDGTYGYSWQSRSTSGNWTSLPSSNVKRYNPGILADTTLYRRIVYSGNGQACKDTSPVKIIKVLPAIFNNIPTTTDNRDCAGEVPKPITGSQPAGGNLSYTYQWMMRTSADWDTIGGATLKNYVSHTVSETTTQFRRIVYSGKYNACVDTSIVLVIDVVPYIQNNITLADQAICEANTPLGLNGAPATGGLGGFTYLWLEKKDEISGWSPATGTNNGVNYTPGPLDTTTRYSRVATSDICPDTSGILTVTVYPKIQNNTISGGDIQYACLHTEKALTGSQPEKGNGSYSYEWQQSDNNTDWTTADGTGKDYNTPALTSPIYFRRVVFSSPGIHECEDISSPVEVRINPLPAGDLIGSVDSVCSGDPVYVKFNTTGMHPPFTVTIKDESGNSYDTIGPGPMTLFPATASAVAMRTFRMFSIVDDSGCVADNSLFTEEARAVVYGNPEPTAGEYAEVCGNTYTLGAQNNFPGSHGEWSDNGAEFTDRTNPESGTTTDQYGLKTYTWTEYNWQCHASADVNILFNEQPAAADAGPDQTLDFSYTTQLEAAIPLVGSGKWTVVSGAGNFNNDTLPDAVIVELDNSTTLKWTVHNGNCAEVSDEVNILINPLEITKGFSPNGDTKNDVFDLGAANAERISLKVYNSAGVLVFESDDYIEGSQWDGRNKNGVELPEGTYFYIADIKIAGREKEFQFRSFVEILR